MSTPIHLQLPRARIHSAGEPSSVARAARRARGRRVPGRARADDHGGRAAVDHRGHGPPGGDLRARGLDPAAAGVLDRQRLPARLRRDDAAGRAAGRPVGRPAVVPRRACRVHRRLVPGGGRPEPRHADRRAARPGRRRRCPGSRRDRRGRAPVRRSRSTPSARRDRSADLPGDGRRTVRRRRPAPGGSCRVGAGRRRDHRRSVVRPPRAGLALGLLHQRPDRDRRPGPGLGGQRRLGDAAPRGQDRPARRLRVHDRSRGRADRADASRQPGRQRRPRPADRDACRHPVRDRRGRARAGGGRRARSTRPVHRRPAVPPPRVLLRGARLAADRLRVRDRDRRRGGVRRPGPVWRSARAAGGPRRAGRGDGGRGARVGLRGPSAVAPGW